MEFIYHIELKPEGLYSYDNRSYSLLNDLKSCSKEKNPCLHLDSLESAAIQFTLERVALSAEDVENKKEKTTVYLSIVKIKECVLIS